MGFASSAAITLPDLCFVFEGSRFGVWGWSEGGGSKHVGFEG